MVKRRNNAKAKAMRRERTIHRKRASARTQGQPMNNRGKKIKVPKGFLIVPTSKEQVGKARSLPKSIMKSINMKEYLLKDAQKRDGKKK
jgi:hypothetical protein